MLTRLLGWTFSRYAAMHFATAKADYFAIDGVIWCIDFIKVRKFLRESLKAILKKDELVFFKAEKLDQYARTLEELRCAGEDGIGGGGGLHDFL